MHEDLPQARPSATGERIALMSAGALAGLAAWGLGEGYEASLIGQRSLLWLAVLLLSFAAGFFTFAGRIGVRPAAIRAVLPALGVTCLTLLYSLRLTDTGEIFDRPADLMAFLAVLFLPLPFLLARFTTGSWRDYPALFSGAWAIVSKAGVAFMFTLIVWGVIWLCATLFDMVGLDRITEVILWRGVPAVISGAVFGLAVAVVTEYSEQLSAELLHRLLRLLLPVVALASLIFVVAVLTRGYEAGFRGFSPAFTMLMAAAAGLILITATLDTGPGSASRSPVLLWSARLMALLLPLLALLSLLAVWFRVSDYSWTENRIFILTLALVTLVYGCIYAGAALWPGDWAARIRRANPWLAMLLIGVAALWMTPLFNARAIAEQSQSLRPAELPELFDAEKQRAEQAARIAPLLDALREEMPVSPPSAMEAALQILAEIPFSSELDILLESCRMSLDDGRPGCVMLMTDLLPTVPGEEAVYIRLMKNGKPRISAWALGPEGALGLEAYPASDLTAYPSLSDERLLQLLRDWQDAPPPLSQAPVNQLGIGSEGLLFMRIR